MDFTIMNYVMQVISILFFGTIIFYTFVDTITLAIQRIKELRGD